MFFFLATLQSTSIQNEYHCLILHYVLFSLPPRYIFDVLIANQIWIERHLDVGAYSSQSPSLFAVGATTGGAAAAAAVAAVESRAPLRLIFEHGTASSSDNSTLGSSSFSPDFNPFRHFGVISGTDGVDVNDDKLVRNFVYDWKAILENGGVDLGLTETGFRHLLRNRPEMQEGAHLTEMEKKQVAVLKSVFDLDPSEA